jgi:hypothetical protein
MSASPSSSTFEWTLQRFPDLRDSTAIVESPRTLLATLFGVPANNLPADITDVATYDGLFDTTQQCVVAIEKALIAVAPATPRVGAVRRQHAGSGRGQGWQKAEFTPSSATPLTPQAALPKLMAVPLRSTAAIPSRRGTTPYRKRDWFRKRTSTAFAAKAS